MIFIKSSTATFEYLSTYFLLTLISCELTNDGLRLITHFVNVSIWKTKCPTGGAILNCYPKAFQYSRAEESYVRPSQYKT